MTDAEGRDRSASVTGRRGLTRAARQLRRDVKRQEEAERKDAVLHLRIEGGLMARIKAEAHERGVSLSDLVRGHLSEHFQEPDPGTSAPEFLGTTHAWVDVNVARDARCAVCKKGLPAGSHGWMAQGPPPPPRVVCGTCYDTLQSAAREDARKNTRKATHDKRQN